MYKIDSFKTSRVLAAQPVFTAEALSEPVMHTEDPIILQYMTNILRLWGLHQKDLPATFVDEVQIQELSRQPFSIIVSEIEIMRKELSSVRKPYSGGSIDQRPLPSQDPFALLPVQAGRFPKEILNENKRIPGGESIEGCTSCNSAGAIACVNCQGGQVVCPDCNGTQSVNCPRCLGMGMHLGARGNMINCQSCRGRRTARCNRCNRGQITCGRCDGSGTRTCASCEGHGNIFTFHELKTSTRTGRMVNTQERMDLPINTAQLENEIDEIGVSVALWPSLLVDASRLREGLPNDLVDRSLLIVQRELNRCNATLNKDERATGLRLRAFGGYMYSIQYKYRDESTRVYVGGIHNRVFSEKESTRKGFILGGLKRIGYHFVNAIANYSSPIDHKYLKAVQAGTVHIGDTRCIVPAVAKTLNIQYEIVEDGYSLVFNTPDRSEIKATIDFNAAKVSVLRLTRDLGIAERNRLAQAMQLNNKLIFGRIAIHREGDLDRFSLEDRRNYEEVQVDSLAKIVKSLAADSQTILSKGWLV